MNYPRGTIAWGNLRAGGGGGEGERGEGLSRNMDTEAKVTRRAT